jgi:hypothetical protein
MSHEEAPPAAAPKSSNFVSLAPFPEEGPAILTVVQYNYIKEHTNVKDDGTTEVFPAVEFYLGTNTPAGPRFVKTWPARYSINERANYAKLYKSVTGHLPAAGSKPNDILGGGVQATIVNQAKVSKLGKNYTASKAKDLGPVFPKLKGEIVPLTTLLPALEKIIAEAGKDKGDKAKDAQPEGKDTDVPF